MNGYMSRLALHTTLSLTDLPQSFSFVVPDILETPESFRRVSIPAEAPPGPFPDDSLHCPAVSVTLVVSPSFSGRLFHLFLDDL